MDGEYLVGSFFGVFPEVCKKYMCHGQKSLYWGWSSHLKNRNPYNGYINPYYWVDDHPLLYGNKGGLDPSTYVCITGLYRDASFFGSCCFDTKK